MPFTITSDASAQYLREEDAVKGFEIAVGNGQSRLALTILVDVINGLMEIFNSFEDELEEEELQPVAVEAPKVQKPVEVTESLEEEVKPATKPAVKKEIKTTEEK